MAIRPFANAPHADKTTIATNWLIGVQTGNTPNAVAEMKYLTFEEFTDYIKSNYGAMWNYRGESSSATPTDPEVNDYFVCTGNFTEGGQSFAYGHMYAYNGNSWDDVSLVLNQYVKVENIADNLTTNDAAKVLSAKQGKILKDSLDADVADLQQQIDAISGGITPKGTVATMNDLPAAAGHTGWMYYVTSEGKYKVSDGSTWLDFGTYPIEAYALRSSFPATGVGQKLYIAMDEKKIYWWDGSTYVSDTAKMAEIDGYYQEMGVGTAEQLVSTQIVEDNKAYLFRTSGGSVDIGNREDDEIVGGTLGVNQLCNSSWDGGNSVSSPVRTEHKISGVVNASSASYYIKCTYSKLIKEHLYLLSVDASSSTGGNAYVSLYINNSVSHSSDAKTLTANVKTHFEFIKRATVSGTGSSYLYVFFTNQTANSSEVMSDIPQCIDITAMFGSEIAEYIFALEQANAGAGVAWFRRYFPKPYYPYNAGSLASVKPSSHDMRGFNAWDEEWEVGGVDSETGLPWSQQRIRPKNFIPILPLTEYFFYCGSLSSDYVAPVRFYDANHNYLGAVNADGVSTYNNTVFKTPANAYFMKFVSNEAYGTVYKNDICINLSWSGTRNGEYEAFEKHSYPLDDSTEYRGIPKLDADGNLYFDGDIYKSSGDVTRRFVLVDLTNIEWVYDSSYPNFYAQQDSRFKVHGEIFCMEYKTVKVEYADMPDMSISITSAGGTRIRFKDSGHTGSNLTPVNNGKAPWLSGKYILVELANSATEQAEPFTNPQIVNDWGTEEYVDTRDMPIPVGHNTKYMANLRDKLQHLPNLANGDGEYIVKQTGTQMELAKTDNLKKDGYYPTLAVGTADNLKGKGTVGADFTFRTAGGSADIGSGSARLDAIEGNTLMMNQKLVATPNASWHINQSVSGHKITVTTTVAGGYCGYQPSEVIPANHKVLMKLKLTLDTETTVRINPYGGGGGLGEVLYTHQSGVYEVLFQKTSYISLIPIYGETVDATYYLENVMLIDLTQMFGAGNEPTVDEFKALFPLDYYDYTEGFPLNFKGTGLKTVGFNEFDGLCENGMWGETGKESASGRTRTTNLIRVIPNTKYYFCYPNSGSRTFLNFQYYDASGNALTNTSITKNRSFITPPNACYVGIFTPPDNFGAFDICINLSWSGVRDGETEPYWDSTLPLPITTIKGKASGSDESVVIFPDGMKSTPIVRDELTAKKATIKAKMIDLGSCNWGYSSSGEYFSTTISDIKPVGSSTDITLMCTVYEPRPKKFSGEMSSQGDMTIRQSADNSGTTTYIMLKNSTKNLSNLDAYGHATWLEGVYLIYPIANPIEYTLDEELNLNYRVDDFGTEQLLPENTSVPVTAPMVAQIAYAMNAVDTLRNLDKNFTNLATLDGLIAIINSKCGVNIVRGNFDSTNNKYTFS